MSSAKYGLRLFFAFLISMPFAAQAQSADNELRGYTPPPMFGGSSTPISPAPPVIETPPSPAPEPEPIKVETKTVPVVSAPIAPEPAPKPAPTPAPKPVSVPVAKPAPVIETPKPAVKIAEPAVEKKPVVKEEPVPTKPVAVKEKAPADVAPVVKKSEVKPAPKPEPLPVVKPEPVQPAPEPATDKSGNISAETLLEHPVTSDTTGPAPDLGPLSESALPLPGKLPAQKKLTAKKPTEKSTDKKVATKKTEAKKTEPKKVEKKPAPKKPEPKPTKIIPAPVKPKPEVKPEPKKADVKKEITPSAPVVPTPKIEAKPEVKTEVKKEEPPAPAVILPVPKAEVKKPAEKSYVIKGKKTMPTAVATKVERDDMMKAPLPPPETDPKLKSLPTPNEQLIDKSLQDHLVEPDLKKIVGAAPAEKAPVDKKAFKNPVGANPPPIMMMNNKNGDIDSAPPKDANVDKIKPELVSLEFKEQATEIPADMKKTIDGSILPKLNANKYARLQILAYASPTKDGQSSARRISLARGLAIRSYMLEKGIEPGRIDIRALGENSLEKPLDRADLMIISYK